MRLCVKNFLAVMNLNQVTIYTNKVGDSIEFYKKLGLKLIVDSAPRYVRFVCPDGDSTLSFMKLRMIHNRSNIVLYFECEDLDREVEGLKNLGLQFEQEPADQDVALARSVSRDPNGNKICLFFAGENRQNPPWRVE